MAGSFLDEIELQALRPERADDADRDDEGRLSISTIHQSKGLEWKDVYIPFFNEGLMPSAYREDTGNRAQRHVHGCAARGSAGGQCDKDCARFFQEGDASRRGTPEERHADEERRLAHVAATRAKDRLVFLQVQAWYRSGRLLPAEPSSYESVLAQLPENVFKSMVLE